LATAVVRLETNIRQEESRIKRIFIEAEALKRQAEKAAAATK
jgi:hypothetical protein